MTLFNSTGNRSFKVHYREYLKHQNEPREDTYYDGASAELDADFVRSSYYERRRIRRIAKRLRRNVD